VKKEVKKEVKQVPIAKVKAEEVNKDSIDTVGLSPFPWLMFGVQCVTSGGCYLEGQAVRQSEEEKRRGRKGGVEVVGGRATSRWREMDYART